MQYKFNKHLQNLLPQRSLKLLVAVSGGADSMCLLDLLFNSDLELELSIAHMNFNLRGEESNADEKLVRDWAKEHGVEIFVESVDTVAYSNEHSISIEMAARDLRYNWFYSLKEKYHFDYIVLAHHANDNAETLLLNVVRGSGIKGICGMKELDSERSLLRPLLNYTRKEIEKHVEYKRIPYRTDHTNSDVEFHRNRIRNLIIPQMEKLNASAVKTINRDMLYFSEAAGILQELFEQKKIGLINMTCDGYIPSLESVRGKNPKRYSQLKLSESLLFSISIEKLLLEKYYRYWLYEILSDYSFNSAQVEDIAQSLSLPETKRIYSPNYTLVKERGYIKVYDSSKIDYSPQSAVIESFNDATSIELSGSEITISVEKNDGSPDDSSLIISADNLQFPLVLRTMVPGDKWCPFGMKGVKKLSDYLTDIKIDSVLKGGVLVLSKGDQTNNPDNIICVPGLEISEFYKVLPSTKNILKISLR